MNPMKITKIILPSLLCLLSASCAKVSEVTSNEQQEVVLNAFLDRYNHENGTNVVPEESGLCILDKEMGKGQLIHKDSYVYLTFNTLALDGSYLSVMDPELAKKLGSYDSRKYYGPVLWTLSDNSRSAGVMEMLCQINQGGYIDAVIPPWLSGRNNDASTENQDLKQNERYQMKISYVFSDLRKFEDDTLKAYAHRYYGGIDTTSRGFYFKSTKELSNDTIPDKTEVRFAYVAKLLDGYVFDTNIADSAKKYGIYDPAKIYGKTTVTYMKTAKEMANMESDIPDDHVKGMKYVLGLAKALKKMYYGEEAVAFFISDLGFGANGDFENNIGVPDNQPICYHIYLDEEPSYVAPDEDEDETDKKE